MIPHEDFLLVLLFFLKVFTPHKMLFLFSSKFVFLLFWKRETWVNVQFALNNNCALEVYGVFAVYHLGFSSKQFQSCNKSLINQACSGPYWENIGPWSLLCARSVLSRPRADILPVRPYFLVNCVTDTVQVTLASYDKYDPKNQLSYPYKTTLPG